MQVNMGIEKREADAYSALPGRLSALGRAASLHY